MALEQEVNAIIEADMDIPASYPEHSCLDTIKKLCKIHGLDEPDYTEFDRLSMERAMVTARQRGGICGCHKLALESVGWRETDEPAQVGDIRILCHPHITMQSAEPFDAGDGNDIFTFMAPDGYYYAWSTAGLRPVLSGHEEGRTFTCRSSPQQ